MTARRPGRRSQRDGFVSTVDFVPLSGGEVDSDDDDDAAGSRRRGRKRKQIHTQYEGGSEADLDEPSGSEEEEYGSRRTRRHSSKQTRNLRSSRHPIYTNDLQGHDDDESDTIPLLSSNLPGAKRQKRKGRPGRPIQPNFVEGGIGYERAKARRTGVNLDAPQGTLEVCKKLMRLKSIVQTRRELECR